MTAIDGLPPEVLSVYKLEPTAYSSKGDAWILTTPEGEVTIKADRGDPSPLRERLIWLQYLLDKGVKAVPVLLRDREGELISHSAGACYYGWVNPAGEAFQAEDPSHLCAVIASLAEIHTLSGQYEKEHESGYKFDWPVQIQARLTDLLFFQRQIQDQRLDDDFQRVFLENFDFIYDQGQEAVQKMILADSTAQGGPRCTNLIDSFLPEDLLIRDNKAIFCSPLAGSRGPRVLDLAAFLRSYMGEQCWDIDLTRSLIQGYRDIAPLEMAEIQLLLSVLRFPARFWLYMRQYQLGERNLPELSLKLINLVYESRLRDRCLDWLDSLLSEGE
jgi:Ser/Thr protein kinase RdoA (MazF antagonist)